MPSYPLGYKKIVDVSGATVGVKDDDAYQSGDVLGGLLTLTGAARIDGSGAVLEAIFIQDGSDQKKDLDVLIFNALPNGATSSFVDNAPIAIDPADLSKLKSLVSFGWEDYHEFNGITAIADFPDIGHSVIPASGLDLYAVLIARDVATYDDDSLGVSFTFRQD
jgi:hypothetical protein